MTHANVHLEDVTRAARHGLMLAVTVSLFATAAMLAVGLSLAVVIPVAALMLALGVTSGGFGLVARVALPRVPRPQRSVAADQLAALRVPQPR